MRNLLEWDLNLRPPYLHAGALPTELSSYWRSPYFVNIFVRGDASQKSFNHILPFSQRSRPSYDATWEGAVRGRGSKGMHHKGIQLFSINIGGNWGNWLGTFLCSSKIYLKMYPVKENLTRAGRSQSGGRRFKFRSSKFFFVHPKFI